MRARAQGRDAYGNKGVNRRLASVFILLGAQTESSGVISRGAIADTRRADRDAVPREDITGLLLPGTKRWNAVEYAEQW